MGFWTSDIKLSPAMQHHFKVRVGSGNFGDADSGGFIWFAKSVTKPTIAYNRAGLDGKRIFNQVADFKPVALDSVPTFGDMTLNLIDPSYPSVARQIMTILNQSGMGHSKGYGYNRHVASNYLEPFIVTQLTHKPEDSELVPLQEWIFDEPVITSVDFGSLDYSSDKFVDIKLTIGYSGFTLQTPENADLTGPQSSNYTNSRLKNTQNTSNNYDASFNTDSLSIFGSNASQNMGVNFTGKLQ
jgi:hypothetical protein